MTKNDSVSHPAHYTSYPHEVIELTEHLGFCLGNAVKYILRAPFKGNELQDLKKARWYIERIAESGNGFASEILINDEDFEMFHELVKTYKNEIVEHLVVAAMEENDGYADADVDYALELLDARIAKLSGNEPEEPEEPEESITTFIYMVDLR